MARDVKNITKESIYNMLVNLIRIRRIDLEYINRMDREY